MIKKRPPADIKKKSGADQPPPEYFSGGAAAKKSAKFHVTAARSACAARPLPLRPPPSAHAVHVSGSYHPYTDSISRPRFFLNCVCLGMRIIFKIIPSLHLHKFESNINEHENQCYICGNMNLFSNSRARPLRSASGWTRR